MAGVTIHEVYKLAAFTKATTSITVDKNAWPQPVNGLIPHVTDIYFDVYKFEGSGSSAATDFTNEWVGPAVTNVEILMQDGRYMVKNCPGHYLFVNKVLQNCEIDTQTIAAETDSQTCADSISLWPAKLSCDGSMYMYPATSFNRLEVVFDFTQVPNQAALDYFSGYLYADLVWIPKEMPSPLRQVARYLGSDARVRIDGGGSTQVVVLSCAKGTDANKWDNGFKVETSRSHWMITDGDALIRHFYRECCCAQTTLTAEDIADTWEDVIQPVIHPYGLYVDDTHGIAGVIKIERINSADPTPDAYVYSLRP